MKRQRVIPEQVVEEEVNAYTVTPDSIHIAVGVGARNGESFVFNEGQEYETITVAGQDFKDLLDQDGGIDKPLPGKPSGTFRKDDLWHFIDKERAKKGV